MYTLYWSPASANMTPHAMLEDIGVPYELIKVDTAKGEQRSPDYLKINPHGRVPALAYDGDKILYETTAIALFLAERHPEAGFAPKPDSPDRPPFLQWMAYLTNTLQIALGHWWRPDNVIDGADRQAEFKAKAEQRVAGMFRFLDEHLAKSGPYLCGRTFYVCDYYAVMLAQWTEFMAIPAHANPHVNKLIRLVMQRPGYARMLKAEGIEQPV
jgi:glutathione S-transferase